MENLTEMSKAVEECETRMDIPGSLPIEVFHEVLLYLSSQDLHNASKCCRKWKKHMETFWKRKCRIEHYFECEDDLNSKFYRNFMERFSYWEGIYMYNSRLRENWLNLNYKEIVVQHDFTVLPSRGFDPIVHYISDDVIIATVGYFDKELLVINCITGVVENRILPPFDQSFGLVIIDAVEIIENQLIVIWTHKTLKYDSNCPLIVYLTVWNLKTAKLLINSKRENIYDVYKVIIYKDLVTVITGFSQVYIFNIKKESLDYEQCNIISACYYNDKIILGSHDGTIQMMDLEYTKLITLKCCTDKRYIKNIVMGKNYLVCACQKGSYNINDNNANRVCVWNIETKTKLYELPNFAYIYTIRLFVNENKLCYSTVRGNFEGLLFKMCHLDTGECVVELNNQQYHVFTNNFLIIQRDKEDHHSLKMQSIKTGEVVADLDTILPYTDQFFATHCVETMATKTKIAYFNYKLSSTDEPFEITLNIIDFQAQLEV